MIDGKTAGGFQPGQRVGGGRYTLLRELGRGGMGVVWLAQDSRLQEEVALKFIPPEVRTDAAALDDLRRETLKSRKLSHPNIIRIHDLFESPDELPFISMEFIDGTPLNTLKAEQPHRLFAWDFLKPLVKQLCDGLDYAHSQKVIHRDLKPGNMMVTREGALKLADFGLAASMSDSISRMSQHLGSSGTPAYMSPQQMRSQAPRVSDDIYALGATLYELLTSKPPFYTGDIYRQVKEEPAVPLEERLADLELTNDIPPDVSALIMACLAKEPEQRPQSAGAVAEWIGLNASNRTSTLVSQVSQSAAPAPVVVEVVQPASQSVVPVVDDEESMVISDTQDIVRGASQTRLWIAAGLAAVAVIAVLVVLLKPKHSDTIAAPQVTPAKTGSPATSADGSGPIATPSRWTNSLGMVFVPLPGKDVMFSVWETRVQDFNAFVKATRHDATGGMKSVGKTAVKTTASQAPGFWADRGNTWNNPGFAQTDLHPVVGVNWEDGVAFCAWLTTKERSEGAISDNQSYRLPKDLEWSQAVGLGPEDGNTPAERRFKITGVYPWGTQWPPPADAGNLAGSEVTAGEWPDALKPLPGYRDAFPRTAPAGSFPANGLGIYDLVGNVMEYCDDWFDASHMSHVRRGSSWDQFDSGSAIRTNMLSSNRYGTGDQRRDSIGFRVVLAGNGGNPQRLSSSTSPNSGGASAHRYQFVPDKVTWIEADQRARAMGGHLVTISNAAEQAYLLQQFGSRFGASKTAIWIGLSQSEAGQPWKWVTGEPLSYTAWSPGEPSYARNGGTWPFHANLYKRPGESVGWNDHGTDDPYAIRQTVGFVVEWENAPIEPSALDASLIPGQWVRVIESSLIKSSGLNSIDLSPNGSGRLTVNGMVPGLRAKNFAARCLVHFPAGIGWFNMGVGTQNSTELQFSVGKGWQSVSFQRVVNDESKTDWGVSCWLRANMETTVQMWFIVTDKECVGRLAEIGGDHRVASIATPSPFSGKALACSVSSNLGNISEFEVMVLDGVPESDWPLQLSNAITTAKRRSN